MMIKTEDPGGGGGGLLGEDPPPNPEALRKTLEDVVSRESYMEVQKMRRD